MTSLKGGKMSTENTPSYERDRIGKPEESYVDSRLDPTNPSPNPGGPSPMPGGPNPLPEVPHPLTGDDPSPNPGGPDPEPGGPDPVVGPHRSKARRVSNGTEDNPGGPSPMQGGPKSIPEVPHPLTGK